MSEEAAPPDREDISSQWPEEYPESGEDTHQTRVRVIHPASVVNADDLPENVTRSAVLRPADIPVPHQGNPSVLHPDYPVNHEMPRGHLCQNYVQRLRGFPAKGFEHDTIPATDDERKHTEALDGHSYLHSFIQKPAHLGNQFAVREFFSHNIIHRETKVLIFWEFALPDSKIVFVFLRDIYSRNSKYTVEQ